VLGVEKVAEQGKKTESGAVESTRSCFTLAVEAAEKGFRFPWEIPPIVVFLFFH
jgi:hypothetical protein